MEPTPTPPVARNFPRRPCCNRAIASRRNKARHLRAGLQIYFVSGSGVSILGSISGRVAVL
jgi:hypothetical protein